LSANLIKSLIEQGYTGIIFNREMSNEEFYKKLFVMESDVLTLADMRKRELDDSVKAELTRLEDILKKKYSNLYTFDNIPDDNGAVMEIRRKKPDFFIDDFIQMVQTSSETRKEGIRDIFLKYSSAVKAANTHGIIISQMNRDVEKRVSLVPQLSDFADASEIEWFCETAIFLQRPFMYDPDEYDEELLKAYCLKSRYGTVGTYNLKFDGLKCRIE
jgi:replicative DNA helicase